MGYNNLPNVPQFPSNPVPVVATSNPGSADNQYALGTIWVNRSSNAVYGLSSITAGAANWEVLGSASGAVATLSADSGGSQSPVGGDIDIAGGTNVTTASSAGTVTVNLDSAITVTSVATDVAAAGMTISGNDIDADGTDANIDLVLSAKGTGKFEVDVGDVAISQTGRGLQVKSGAATDMLGEATLSSGTVTVANTNIASGDLILLSRRSVNSSTTLGELTYSISDATSFTITSAQSGTPGSTQTGDTSIVSYMIVRPL